MDGVASSVTARPAASFLHEAEPRTPRGPSRGPKAPRARGPRIVARLRLARQAPRQKTALLVALIWGLTGGSPALGQDQAYPIFTADQLDATMKTLGPNIASGIRSILNGYQG